jgi:hypothetical protein
MSTEELEQFKTLVYEREVISEKYSQEAASLRAYCHLLIGIIKKELPNYAIPEYQGVLEKG